MSSGTAGQHGVLATRSNGGKVGGFNARGPMPDAINAPMDANKRPPTQPLFDLGPGHAGAQESRARHHSMGRGCDPSEFLLHRPILGSHYDL